MFVFGLSLTFTNIKIGFEEVVLKMVLRRPPQIKSHYIEKSNILYRTIQKNCAL